jgi:hypothetical protein
MMYGAECLPVLEMDGILSMMTCKKECVYDKP